MFSRKVPALFPNSPNPALNSSIFPNIPDQHNPQRPTPPTSPNCPKKMLQHSILFFILLLTSPSLPHARLDRPRGSNQPSYSPSCLPKCKTIESTHLKPMQPCNKWRRAPGQPTIGDICTDKFFEGFRKVCEEACNAKAKFDDGLGVEGEDYMGDRSF